MMRDGQERTERTGAGGESRPDRPVEHDSGKALPGMKMEQFFKHHGIVGNPFSEEDAQTDTVFKRRCLATIHHPAWNKFFGSPADPSTALVFGEKGSGKTALRLQADSELEAYNQQHPERAGLRHLLRRLQPVPRPLPDGDRAPRTWARPWRRWRLQDHMDAILSLGVTHLVDLLTDREGRPLGPEPGPAPRPAAAGGALRRSRPASRSSGAGAGSAAARASGRSGAAATSRSASARPWSSSRLIAAVPRRCGR